MNAGSEFAVTNIGKYILDELEARIVEVGVREFSDEDLLSLHSVYGTVLQKALDILEKYITLVVYTTTIKSRKLIEIKGDHDRCYRVFPRINFCPCQAFRYHVIEKKSHLTCKHVLAARIALILGNCTEHEVTQDQYLMLIRSMFTFKDS